MQDLLEIFPFSDEEITSKLVIHTLGDIKKQVREEQLRDQITEVGINQNSIIEEEELLIVTYARSHDQPLWSEHCEVDCSSGGV